MREPFEVGTEVEIISVGVDGKIEHYSVVEGEYRYYVTTGQKSDIGLGLGYYCSGTDLILNLTKESYNPADLETGRFVVLDMHSVGEKWLGQFLGYTSSRMSAIIQLIETAEAVFVPVGALNDMMELVPRGKADAVRAKLGKPGHAGKNGYIPPERLEEWIQP